MDNIHNTEWLLFMILFGHIIIAPFTKVEESFNVQAIHDMLYHRLNWTNYDHREFPGVVPRTFMGPLAISSMLYPFLPIFGWLNLEKFWTLFAVRIMLGLAVLISFANFARSVDTIGIFQGFRVDKLGSNGILYTRNSDCNCFGKNTGTFIRLITASQFHFLFYASRPLPNMFAMVLVLIVYQKWFNGDFNGAAIYATIATFLFRFELILLFGPIFLNIFANNPNKIIKLILVGIGTLLLTLVVSVPLDSFLWGKWIWPEGEVIRFNIWMNRSHEYGTSPFWWYFTSALPRALLLSLFLVPIGLLIHQHKQRSLAMTTLPAFILVLLYSFLPHKELRFILYAVPLLNVSSAFFCGWVWDNARRSWLYRLLSISVVVHLLGNALITSQFLYASSRNYPGGDALMMLQYKHRFLRNKPISVHIDNYCAETGISRFLQLFNSWEYNKTEGLTPDSLTRFDYILIGAINKEKFFNAFTENNRTSTHIEHFTVDGFHKISWQQFATIVPPHWLRKTPIKLYHPNIGLRPKVIVLKKNDL